MEVNIKKKIIGLIVPAACYKLYFGINIPKWLLRNPEQTDFLRVFEKKYDLNTIVYHEAFQ